MLAFTQRSWLVAASFAVARFAGFSGLSLLRGASLRPEGQRKLLVVVAAVVPGGGIWSMHFVAMPGLQLPILFYQDGVITLISALVAILVVGLALLLLHFGTRTPAKRAIAGSFVGLGILVMHYVGMLGMELCGPVFPPAGIAIATLVAGQPAVAGRGAPGAWHLTSQRVQRIRMSCRRQRHSAARRWRPRPRP